MLTKPPTEIEIARLLNDINMLPEGKDILRRLIYQRDKYTRYHRWNFEIDNDRVMVCKNEHDKGQPCEYEELSPTELVEMLSI